MPAATSQKKAWWGMFRLGLNQAGRWEIGPSTIWVYRLEREWRIVHTQQEDPMRDAAEVVLPVPDEDVNLALDAVSAHATVSRFSFRQTGTVIALQPALADRPMIVRPEKPLYVTEGESITLYVTTPVWIRFEVDEPPRLLQELPVHRPSDTWFGSNTREGELCYAIRTTGRIRLEDLPRRLHRALTPIVLRNRAAQAWLIERIQLPMQYLALYQTPDGFLWTQALHLEREVDGHLADLRVAEGIPAEAVDARLVHEPRQASRTGLIARTISTLFSKIKEA